MELDQTTLRGILATILSNSNKTNETYIVPKQGNWWNPQEALAIPDTWCAYQIRSDRPVTAPWYEDGVNNNAPAPRVLCNRIATIDLQFVGPQAETLAQSVALWPNRVDVQKEFAKVGGAVMYSDMEARSSSFYQDGTNHVLAWNVQLKVHWVQEMYTGQLGITGAELGGTINTIDPTR